MLHIALQLNHYRQNRQRVVLSGLVLSVMWTELATSQDCRRQNISKLFCPVSKCGQDYWNQSDVVDNSVHTTDYTQQDSGVLQVRYHVFKAGGPVAWSRVLLPFYRNKIDRSIQFGAVGYVITLYSSKSYVKTWGVRPNFLGGADPQCLHPWCLVSGVNEAIVSYCWSCCVVADWSVDHWV